MSNATPPPVVCSHNEWDPLEEVIVGIVDDAVFPAWDTINRHTVPPGEWEEAYQRIVPRLGAPYPPEMVRRARVAIDGLAQLLEAEGVTVRRPDRMDFSRGFSSPAWSVDSGFCAANPRDVLLVVGDQIIEAPMSDRARHYETWPYRSLLKDYSRRGARWTAAPKPQLTDALYDPNYRYPEPGEDIRYVLTEHEPVFDAAEFARCGRDLFTQLSHATNRFGVEWLQRHLGDGYRVHLLKSRDPHAIHLDTTFVPLAPGKVLVNPKYLDPDALPEVLKHWDVLVAPPEAPTSAHARGLLSDWIHVNLLVLDGERVIVEAQQEPLIRALKDWGFKPIPYPFMDYYPFVGSLHCATLDVRRRGSLQSYV